MIIRKMGTVMFLSGDLGICVSYEVSAVTKYQNYKNNVQALSVSVDSVFVHKKRNDNELSKMIDKDIPFLCYLTRMEA